MHIEYIRDQDVSDSLDANLRTLLSNSFRDEDNVFVRRRYYKEPPQHRYLLWDGVHLAGHIAVHDKAIESEGKRYRIAGIAEVCIDPQYRQQGWIKRMLEQIHHERLALGDDFACLFGETQYYQSSGYHEAKKLQLLTEQEQWVYIQKGMYCELNQRWPKGDVRLLGMTF